jgi:hypothetical protein
MAQIPDATKQVRQRAVPLHERDRRRHARRVAAPGFSRTKGIFAAIS